MFAQKLSAAAQKAEQEHARDKNAELVKLREDAVAYIKDQCLRAAERREYSFDWDPSHLNQRCKLVTIREVRSLVAPPSRGVINDFVSLGDNTRDISAFTL
jgi:hypothetical protein